CRDVIYHVSTSKFIPGFSNARFLYFVREHTCANICHPLKQALQSMFLKNFTLDYLLSFS
ncbi:MAG: hypothetical protein WBA07_04920, partial [Rivularia sp. (in: cyanobacteria)]